MGFEQRLSPKGNERFLNRKTEGIQIHDTGSVSRHSRQDGSEHANTTRIGIKVFGRES